MSVVISALTRICLRRFGSLPASTVPEAKSMGDPNNSKGWTDFPTLRGLGIKLSVWPRKDRQTSQSLLSMGEAHCARNWV